VQHGKRTTIYSRSNSIMLAGPTLEPDRGRVGGLSGFTSSSSRVVAFGHIPPNPTQVGGAPWDPPAPGPGGRAGGGCAPAGAPPSPAGSAPVRSTPQAPPISPHHIGMNQPPEEASGKSTSQGSRRRGRKISAKVRLWRESLHPFPPDAPSTLGSRWGSLPHNGPLGGSRRPSGPP